MTLVRFNKRHRGDLARLHGEMDDLFGGFFRGFDGPFAGCKAWPAVDVAEEEDAIIVRAEVNNKIKLGVIWIPFHFTESPANILTNDAFCPISRTGEYKACAAKVEKA